MFSFSVVFDCLQKVSVTPMKSFEAFSIRDWLNPWTVRVKGGMNLWGGMSGMWHGLPNDIIMRNLIYRKWRQKKFNRKARARLFRALFLAPIWASNRFAGQKKKNNLHKKFNGRILGVSNSIRNKVISIWNIKQSISINIFKKKIKQFLLSE